MPTCGNGQSAGIIFGTLPKAALLQLAGLLVALTGKSNSVCRRLSARFCSIALPIADAASFDLVALDGAARADETMSTATLMVICTKAAAQSGRLYQFDFRLRLDRRASLWQDAKEASSYLRQAFAHLRPKLCLP